MRNPHRWGGTVLAVVAVLVLGGCSRAISGTAVAPPGAAAEAALLSTTCRAYISMNKTARREVITAIGDNGNKLAQANPDLWVGLAAALCAFTNPTTPVKDAITGGIR